MLKVDKKEYSMSNDAINHTVQLDVVNGEYFITMQFKGLAIYNQFGYLMNLSYYDEGYSINKYGAPVGALIPAEVLSYQKDSDGNMVIDKYNDENHLYPQMIRIKLVDGIDAEYVPLQVFVPIMEAIATGTGTQNVYMKLDWSTLKATESDIEIEKPVEQSPAVDVTDDATGVKVHADKGVFEEGVKLVVTPITSGADYNLAASALQEVGKKFKLYEIHFDDANGSEVQPNGTVTVSYPIPEGYDAENVALYRINDDGSKTLIKGTVDGNYYTVITKSFSTYALVEKDSTITDDQNIQNVNNGTFGNNSNNNSDNSSNNNDSNVTGSTQDGGVNAPQTGDNSNIALGIMLMFASAGMLAVLTFKRKRRIREGE
jgi:LPXTG-motif cell wall-anchored protein